MNREQALNDISRKIESSKNIFFWTCGIAGSCYLAYFVVLYITLCRIGLHFYS